MHILENHGTLLQESFSISLMHAYIPYDRNQVDPFPLLYSWFMILRNLGCTLRCSS